MSMWVRQIILFFLLMSDMASSFAGSAWYGRDALRSLIFPAQNPALGRDPLRRDQQISPQNEESPLSRELSFPESSGYGGQMDDSLKASEPRRQSRMTLEERRALRRQIDEASHDIYAPKR